MFPPVAPRGIRISLQIPLHGTHSNPEHIRHRLLPDQPITHTLRKEKRSLVLPGRKGVLTDIRDSLKGACKRAGVPRLHVHGLRHTFGSQMAMAGADPFAIMKAMGHADNKTTMIYVSLGKSCIREQVEKLNAIGLLSPPTKPIKALPASAYAN
jgi:integrase